MVTKVVTDKDVDGVTIIINTENKLACATPASGGSTTVEIEELSYREFIGSDDTIRPFMSKLWVDNKEYPINKVGRIKGTNWLVFQADGLLGSTTGGDTGGGTGEDLNAEILTIAGLAAE